MDLKIIAQQLNKELESLMNSLNDENEFIILDKLIELYNVVRKMIDYNINSNKDINDIEYLKYVLFEIARAQDKISCEEDEE